MNKLEFEKFEPLLSNLGKVQILFGIKKFMMKLKNYLFKIKYFFKKFEFLKVYNSPFKPIIPKLYIGKVAVGTPYFFPRNWVKSNSCISKRIYFKNNEIRTKF